MRVLLLVVAIMVVLYWIAKTWYEAIKDMVREETEERHKQEIKMLKRTCEGYKQAYRDLRNNTQIEVVYKGNWEGLK